MQLREFATLSLRADFLNLRGNLVFTKSVFWYFITIDCHDFSLFDKNLDSNNEGNPYWAKYCTNYRNDKLFLKPIKIANLQNLQICKNLQNPK